MEQIERDGVCPFCVGNLRKYHKRPIIKDGKWWLYTENMYPYQGTKTHILFIHKTHITTLKEVSPQALLELFDMIISASETYKVTGGTILWRFGDMQYNGSSVSHLHVQLVVGDANNPNHGGVRVKIG